MRRSGGKRAGIVLVWILVAVLLFSAVPPVRGAHAAGGETVAPTEGAEKSASEPETGRAESEPGESVAGRLSSHFPGWARREVMGVALWQMIGAFVLILAGLVLKKVTDFVMERKLIPVLEKTRFRFDALLARAARAPLSYLFFLLGLAGAVAVMPLPTEPDIQGFAHALLKVLLGVELVWFLFRMVDVLVEYLGKLASRTDSQLDDQLIPVIRKALKLTIGVLCGVWIIQLLGYSVSSLIAGLGIGGLAVALALQDTLANFFGSVFLFLDRPFVVGDRIQLNDVDGYVEQIGFRSTRIRTLDGTLVSMPNKSVANATIDNWTRMPKRRVLQTVGVTYESSADQMEEVVAAIRELIHADDGVDEEFVVVRFSDFGDSSLNIFVCYYTKGVTLEEHLKTKERLNLAIIRAVRGMGLSMAFPTRTLYFEGEIAERISEGLVPEPAPDGERGPGNA